MAFCDEKMKEIGQRIKKKRKEAHLTQEELLKRIHLSTTSKQSLRSWERGQRLPDLETMVRLCEVFNCDLGYLQADYEESTFALHKVSEYTGLTEDAAKWLHSLSVSNSGAGVDNDFIAHIDTISRLICSEDALDALNEIGFFRAYTRRSAAPKNTLSCEDFEKMHELAAASGNEIANRNELCELHMQRAAELFKDACRKMV